MNEYEEMKIVHKEDNVNFKKKLFRILRAWPLFLLSLVICFSLSYLYIRSISPVYQAVASIMVKDEKKGADLIYNNALEEMGLGVNAKLVENEIELLKSYDLLASVVDSLQLFVSVNSADKQKATSVFEDELPFTIQILNPTAIKQKRQWVIVDSGHILNFKAEHDKQAILLEFGKQYSIGGIHFRLRQQEGFDSSWIMIRKNTTHKYKIEINPVDETIIEYSKKLDVEPASKVSTVINLG